jgi:hypothetical protein
MQGTPLVSLKSTHVAEWPLNNYDLTINSAEVITPTLVTPVITAGTGFSTAGFTCPSGANGFYFLEVYGELVNTGGSLNYATVSLKKNSTSFFRRQQINANSTAVITAFNATLTTLILLSVGDSVRPEFTISNNSGTTKLNNCSFLVYRLLQ